MVKVRIGYMSHFGEVKEYLFETEKEAIEILKNLGFSEALTFGYIRNFSEEELIDYKNWFEKMYPFTEDFEFHRECLWAHIIYMEVTKREYFEEEFSYKFLKR